MATCMTIEGGPARGYGDPVTTAGGGDVPRVDPRVDRTREAVLRAVRELLVEEGWDSVTQNQVARRSGVGRTTVYRHWPDRTELVREAMDFELSVTRDVTLSGELRTDLITALEAIRFEMIEREGSKFLIAMVARSEWDGAVQAVKKDLVDRAVVGLRGVLVAAVARGDLVADLDLDRSISQLVGPMVMHRLVTDLPLRPDMVTHLVDDFIATRAAPRSN
jgi:AcrR family transcriptional regulator